MKKLGFGAMRLPHIEKNGENVVDIELTKKMVDEFIARGFTYFDTAWMYCNGTSEAAMKEALVDRYPRDSFTLATKIPSYMVKSFEDRDKLFNEQLRRTGAGYFDYYLVHDVNSKSIETFNKFDCFSFVREKKEQGLAKKIGFSFHDGPELLDKILTEHPEMEFVQLQINYLDWDSKSVQSRACWEVAKKHGKDIIVMEPVKGGALANVSEDVEKLFKDHSPEMSVASWAIRFAAGLDGVFMVLSGMSNMEQLLDNVSYMEDFKPLTDGEVGMVHHAADIINGMIEVACTGCEYCIVNCPKNINIPKLFSLYNADLKDKKRTSEMGCYETLIETSGSPSDCIACGQCESMCPQHLEIIETLKKVAERFE